MCILFSAGTGMTVFFIVFKPGTSVTVAQYRYTSLAFEIVYTVI